MKKVLIKRFPREVRANLFRYLSLFFMIALCMYIVIALVDAAEIVIRGTDLNQKNSNLEDGQVTLFTPLLDDQIEEIEKAGVTIEPHISYDINMEDGSVLRIFKNRQKVDLIVLDKYGVNNKNESYGTDPHLAQSSNEIVLEKRYAEEHDLSVGDHIRIGKEDYLITGIGSTVDYDAPYKKLSDTAVDSKTFGVAFVTSDEYDRIKNLNDVGTEELTYAFVLNDVMTGDDLKQMIKDFEFDYKCVKDEYYQEMLSDTYGKRDEITDGINDLVDGVDELYDGADELKDGTKEFKDGIQELYDGSSELCDGTKELKDGAGDLKDGAAELKDGSRELNDGSNDMKDGAHALWNGLAELKGGANELDDALHELEKNNGAITGGAQEIFDGFLSMAQDSINAQITVMGAPAVSLTKENYKEVLDSVSAMISSVGGDTSEIAKLKVSLDGIAQYVDGTKAYTDALGEISSGASKLNAGAMEAVNGAYALETGAGKLNEGTTELSDGIDELYDGSGELYDGTDELNDGAKELNDGVKEAYDASIDLDDGAQELYDGVKELKDGVDDLKKQSDDMMDEIFSESPDNIMEFMLKEDNLRIGGAAGDIEINKTIGMVAGIIVIVLFTYVLSVFVIHQIQNESSVIGTLYALGVKKKDLMAHYITIPTVLSFLGGMTGALIGLSGLGSSWQMSDSYEYYSLPWFERVIPPYLLIYAVVMPPLVSMIVNYLVINKSLSRTALSLIKNEQKVNKSKDIRLGDMPFMRKFKIRQMLRERRTAFTIVAGMLIALLIFMMGMDCYVLCESVGRLSSKDTRYEYMYTYKYPTKEVVAGGEACFVKTLKKELYGYTLDVTVMGIDDDNPYIDIKPVKGKNKIVASDAAAARYGLKTGDKLVLCDNANDIDYAFTVADIVPYSVGITVFMDIDSMRELFGEDDDYYNVVMADHELDIESGRLYSTTTKIDIDRSSGIFSDLMRPMVTMLLSMSVVIFCIVMYLMTSVMIDRAGFGISLLKIFGFNPREVKKLYLDGNRLVVIIGAIISIPIAKIIMDTIFPIFIANVACSIHLEYRWYHYVMLFAGIIICYDLISMILTRKLGKISPAEVLKNRE